MEKQQEDISQKLKENNPSTKIYISRKSIFEI